MVQGAKSGGGVSAPIAQKIMEESLASRKVSIRDWWPSKPAVGSFTPIEMVDYKKTDVPPNLATQDDRETADHTEIAAPGKKKGEKQIAAKPESARPPMRAARCRAKDRSSSSSTPAKEFPPEALRRWKKYQSTAFSPPLEKAQPVLSKLYPKLISMTERVKRLIGLAPRQTGNKLIINCEKLERRVALLENGILEEYSIERQTDRNIVGSIFKGRVKNIEHGLKAMFVDIGFEKNAFLHFWDALPAALDSGIEQVERSGGKKESKRLTAKDIPSVYPVGSEVLVQVTKGPISTPKARASPPIFPSPDAILVLMPYSDQCGISRKIESPKERDRLRKILKELDIPEGMGLIVRTVGEGQRERYFVRDLGLLIEQWRAIEAAMKTKPAPACVFEEPDLIERTVRDFLTDEIDEVICDDENAVKRMIEVVGQISKRSASRIKHYSGPLPVLENFNVQKQIDDAFHRQVWLPCGGYIVIDETEALIAIDVNTGATRAARTSKKTILQTNLEAATKWPARCACATSAASSSATSST